MLDPISLALGVAQYAVPRVAKWIAGDNGEEVAREVLDVAKKATGADNDVAVLSALKRKPAALAKFQADMAQVELRLFQAENERLESINKTMRAEVNSNDGYVRRWRPTFGYVMAGTWCLQILGTVAGMVWAVVAEPLNSGMILKGIADANAATVPMWAVALSVIGVSVAKRSQDKKVAAGQDGGPTMLSAIAGKIMGGGGG